ncbi:DUF4192 domain-containing protein [Leekyejoonella antrihumi]|nr:DUF4192 domain-containing protein [Leekyejoonella antrihumi]
MSVDPPLVISGLDGLVAYAPYAVGFHPEDAVVVIPVGFNTEVPAARQDIDAALENSDLSADRLRRVYSRYEHLEMAVLAYTEDQDRAEKALGITARALPENVTITAQLQVSAEQWRETISERTGPIDSAVSSQVAAELVLRGRRTPWSSQDELAQSFGPDHVLSDRVLAAAAGSRDPSLAGERDWVKRTVETAVRTQTKLGDPDAARLLQDLADIGLRDTAWSTLTVDCAAGQAALWKDLTRRAPERLRTPAATLAAFSYWLTGDGMQARVALDHAPALDTYTMARLVQTALHHAVPPNCWTRLPEQPAPTRQESHAWAAEVAAHGHAVSPSANVDRDEASRQPLTAPRSRRPEHRQPPAGGPQPGVGPTP